MATDTVHSQGRSTYDVHIEIDIDCEELVDACGLAYTRSLNDDTQNVIIFTLDKDEYIELITDNMWGFNNVNEQTIGTALLNPELGEYVTKAIIYKPNGDNITFE